jgi:23S rRNA pseudouridine2457 synthase
VRYLAFYKPFQVLCQFSRDGAKKTLADYISIPHVYPAGRLDFDSEGLLLLTDDGALQHQLTDPRFGHARTYWVQVEGAVSSAAVEQLQRGVVIGGQKTLPCNACIMPEPTLPARHPPVRFRKSIPTSWLSLTLREGRNRQVRHMTAAVGFPTLRLTRVAMGGLSLAGLQPGLQPGDWHDLNSAELSAVRQYSAETTRPARL